MNWTEIEYWSRIMDDECFEIALTECEQLAFDFQGAGHGLEAYRAKEADHMSNALTHPNGNWD